MKNVFNAADVAELTVRINALTSTTLPQWGKMSVDQMLAHVNVAYEMVYDNRHPKPSWLMRFALKTFVKEKVVGPTPYAKNSPTAPVFRMTGVKEFAREQQRLLAFLERVQADGTRTFEGKESPSFGPLTAAEWNVLFSKHLDHHLTQFGV
ncbi:DinB family protein [Gemmatimonas sp.]|uniref:DinB family protein n=1 Tax=Gemmatimonas sp. TaxID=1962908 RepID=UPI00398312FF